jgi:hypothetical protein
MPFAVADRAAWTTRSTEAVGRQEGGVVQVAIGSGAIGRRSSEGKHVNCILLPLEDAQMAELAQAEGRMTALPDLAAAMATLRGYGVGVTQASRVMGLSPGDGCRLYQISALPDRVKEQLRLKDERGRPRYTLNHARWVLGVPEAEALEALRSHTKVAELKAWRSGLGKVRPTNPKAGKANEAPDPMVVEALETERRYIAEDVLQAPVTLKAGTEGKRIMTVEFGSVEEIQGVWRKMVEGRGEAPRHKKGDPMRSMTLAGLSDAEIAYLVGTSGDR